ncbi:hypothetical protein MTR67_022987 [Solanum verrucosum]|uniref:Uncharacterized protein n=1 Tax=Solanum verrucosum TaxID=315347 RepID=A0AAF0TR08_SOLVR|nr:hypothetical protein MTR67_022987 [Solanum verrucosum]
MGPRKVLPKLDGFSGSSTSVYGLPVRASRSRHVGSLSMGYINPLNPKVRDTNCETPTLESVLSVNEFLEVFPDDLLGSEDEHVENLSIVLQALKDRELYAKFSKYEFWFRSVAFHVHIVLCGGTRVDPKKIEAVKNWPRPFSTLDIQSFLDLTGYSRRLFFLCLDATRESHHLCFKAIEGDLSRSSMGSVAHVEDDKKELVRDVHRLTQLGGHLVDSNEGGVIVHNGSKSSFVSYVKAKQYNNLVQVDFEEVNFEKSR